MEPSDLNKYRSILELQVEFDEKDLKSAYRKMMFICHPDRHHNNVEMREVASEKAKVINAAFEYLSELLEAGVIGPGKGRTRKQGVDYYSNYRTQHSYQGTTYCEGFPDPNVVEIFLKSSHIISAGYDYPSKTLYIKFKGDIVYRYSEVPGYVWKQFLYAESHGKYAHRYIYTTFQYVRC